MCRRLSAVIALAVAMGACGRIGYEAVGRVDAGSGNAGTSGAVGAGGTNGAGGNSTGGNAAGGSIGPTGAGGTSGVSGAGGSTGVSGAGGSGGTLGPGGNGGALGAGGTTGVGGAVGAAGVSGAGGTGGTTGTGGGVDGGSCAEATYGGHTYALCDGPLSWNDAQADCVARGMRLVRIDDAQENQWVLATAFAAVPGTENQSFVWRWLGGTDVAVTGEWRWTDGALFWLGGSTGSAQNGLYANWLNNRPTSGGTATDCAIMQHNTQGFWTDWDCTRLQPYVCEQY